MLLQWTVISHVDKSVRTTDYFQNRQGSFASLPADPSLNVDYVNRYQSENMTPGRYPSADLLKFQKEFRRNVEKPTVLG